jgi:hypothetical protein
MVFLKRKALLPMVPVETEGFLSLFTGSEAVVQYFYDDGDGLLAVDPVLGSGGFGTLCCGGDGGAE